MDKKKSGGKKQRIILIGLQYDYFPYNEVYRALSGQDVTREDVEEFRKGLESLLIKHNAVPAGSPGPPDQRCRGFDYDGGELIEYSNVKRYGFDKYWTVDDEIEKYGIADLRVCYLLHRHHGKLRDPRPDNLLIRLQLEGKYENTKNKLVQAIVQYVSKSNFKILPNKAAKKEYLISKVFF